MDFEKSLNLTFQQYFILFFKKFRDFFKKNIDGIFNGTSNSNKSALSFEKNINYIQNPNKSVIHFLK